MRKYVCLLIILNAVFFTYMYMSHIYDDMYIHLRSEVRGATGVDISYPYKDDPEKLNHAWFDN